MLEELGRKLPVYFYQVCKEPQENGGWTDQRNWNFVSTDSRLSILASVPGGYRDQS